MSYPPTILIKLYVAYILIKHLARYWQLAKLENSQEQIQQIECNRRQQKERTEQKQSRSCKNIDPRPMGCVVAASYYASRLAGQGRRSTLHSTSPSPRTRT